MITAFYEQFGTARDVLKIDERTPPKPAAGEVRVELKSSGVNTGSCWTSRMRLFAWSNDARLAGALVANMA